MARERNPARNRARRIWLDSGGTLTARQVAEQVGAKPEQVRKWKSMDGWKAEPAAHSPTRKRGGQPGNKNAVGAGAPAGNRNAETHGAYSTVRLTNLSPEDRAVVEGVTLNSEQNMLAELQLLIAKEIDLQRKISALEGAPPESLYVDRIMEMRTLKGKEGLKQPQEKPEAPPDSSGNRQTEPTENNYSVTMQTVIKASAFERTMKLEAELNRVHGRIIKLLDSIKSYELERRRVCLEERKYNLAKQKLTHTFEVDPETGEIDDESDPDNDQTNDGLSL